MVRKAEGVFIST